MILRDVAVAVSLFSVFNTSQPSTPGKEIERDCDRPYFARQAEGFFTVTGANGEIAGEPRAVEISS